MTKVEMLDDVISLITKQIKLKHEYYDTSYEVINNRAEVGAELSFEDKENNIQVSAMGSNDEFVSDLLDEVEQSSIYKDENSNLIISIDKIVKAAKRIIYINDSDDYLSLALRYNDPNFNYDLVLEVSIKDSIGKYSEKANLIIRCFYKQDGKVNEVINSETSNSDAVINHNDEATYLKLKSNGPSLLEA